MFFNQVKLSGDGAALTHNSGLVVFSFSLLDDGQAVMSSSGNIFMCTFGRLFREGNAPNCLLLICPGNHTISVVKCKEDYDTLRTSLQNVIREINSLSKEKVLEVDGKQLKIHPYLGGDYKVNKSRHN